MAVDWEKVLIAYINHVGYLEGTDFLPAELDGLTPEENEGLKQAATKAWNTIPEHVVICELSDFICGLAPPRGVSISVHGVNTGVHAVNT